MVFSKWESFLEKHIEGFFNKKFAGELEPAEVVRQLEREMVRAQRKTSEGLVVPNTCRIQMCEDDYHRLCSRRFTEELHTLMEKLVISSVCFMEGRLQVLLEKKPDSPAGFCAVELFSREEAAEQQDEVKPHTIVLDRSNFQPPLNLPTEYKLTSLTVTDGPDLDAYLEFGEKQIYIGRRDKNDFILTDPNASRLHASITYEQHRHMLQDAQSLNGTFVNGRPVTKCCLCPGDEIRIGNTVLLYEVI